MSEINQLEKERKALQLFITRNTLTYQKVKSVPDNLIEKYRGILPDELIYIWEQMGFGIYENGFLQLINPDEFEFVFQHIDKLLNPTIVIGITALGDLIVWEGNEGRTVAIDEGNRCKIIFINEQRDRASTNISYFLGLLISNNDALKDRSFFNSKIYFDLKEQLPKLEYGQCYGYVPALALGGKKSIKNIQIVDAKSYIEIIGQAVGKIVDLGR